MILCTFLFQSTFFRSFESSGFKKSIYTINNCLIRWCCCVCIVSFTPNKRTITTTITQIKLDSAFYNHTTARWYYILFNYRKCNASTIIKTWIARERDDAEVFFLWILYYCSEYCEIDWFKNFCSQNFAAMRLRTELYAEWPIFDCHSDQTSRRLKFSRIASSKTKIWCLNIAKVNDSNSVDLIQRW